MESETGIYEILQWIVGEGGAVLVIAWIASWLLDDWRRWSDLQAKWKKLIILAGSVLLSVAALALSANYQLVEKIAPYLDAVIKAAMVWLATQVAHKVDKVF